MSLAWHAVGEFGAGLATLVRGATLLVRRPRLLLLGALPPLVTTLAFLAALAVLFARLGWITATLTPFAAGWPPGLAVALRITVGVALVVGSVLVMVVSFSTLTLALGAPVYDRIAVAVEAELGGAPPEVPERLAVAVARTVRQAVVLVLASVFGSLLALLVGLLPVVGAVIGPALSLLIGGWLLAIELVGSALDRRGRRRLSDRRALLRVSRARVLGFAVPVFALMAVPLLAIVVFPVATAGGTVLARDLLARDLAEVDRQMRGGSAPTTKRDSPRKR